MPKNPNIQERSKVLENLSPLQKALLVISFITLLCSPLVMQQVQDFVENSAKYVYEQEQEEATQLFFETLINEVSAEPKVQEIIRECGLYPAQWSYHVQPGDTLWQLARTIRTVEPWFRNPDIQGITPLEQISLSQANTIDTKGTIYTTDRLLLHPTPGTIEFLKENNQFPVSDPPSGYTSEEWALEISQRHGIELEHRATRLANLLQRSAWQEIAVDHLVLRDLCISLAFRTNGVSWDQAAIYEALHNYTQRIEASSFLTHEMEWFETRKNRINTLLGKSDIDIEVPADYQQRIIFIPKINSLQNGTLISPYRDDTLHQISSYTAANGFVIVTGNFLDVEKDFYGTVYSGNTQLTTKGVPITDASFYLDSAVFRPLFDATSENENQEEPPEHLFYKPLLQQRLRDIFFIDQELSLTSETTDILYFFSVLKESGLNDTDALRILMRASFYDEDFLRFVEIYQAFIAKNRGAALQSVVYYEVEEVAGLPGLLDTDYGEFVTSPRLQEIQQEFLTAIWDYQQE